MAVQIDRRGGGASGVTAYAAARYIAIAAALATAVLYVLIGFRVVWIGESAQGGTPDLLGFGLTLGATYTALALVIAFVQRRFVWIAVALVDLFVIVGYFAMWNLRVPPFEVWGLLTKAAQLVMFVALAYLAFRPRALEKMR